MNQSRPRVVAVTNQKGGVGKTTTAVGLAGALAQRGRRVVLVDLDPQGHATVGALGLPPAAGAATLAAGLLGELPEGAGAADLVVPHSTTATGGALEVLPTSRTMIGIARDLDRVRAREHRLSRLLEHLTATADEGWDDVVIDCPPSLDVLTDNALTAADGVVVPVQADDSSLDALRLLLAQVQAVDADLRSTPLVLHGLVVSMLRRPPSTIARTVLAELDRLPLDVLATVPALTVLTEAWRAGQPVTAYAPNSEPAAAYAALATRLSTHPQENR